MSRLAVLSRMTRVVLFAAVAFAGETSSAADSAEIVKQHAENLRRMWTIHLKLEYRDQYESAEGVVEGAHQVVEIWKEGLNERYTRQILRRAGKDGTYEDVPPELQWRDYSADTTEIRNSTGWTPETRDLPVDAVQDRKRFERLHCSIAARVPTELLGGEWRWLLVEMANAHTLEQLADHATLTVTEETPDVARLRVDAVDATMPRLAHLAGAEIEIDKTHGFLIRRRVTAKGYVSEVKRFVQVGETWFPEEIVMRAGPIASTTIVQFVELNNPIAPDTFRLEFVQGARVDNPDQGVLYIWGDGRPAETFANHQAFVAYLEAQMRKSAQGGSLDLESPSPGGNRVLLAVNVAVLILVVILLVIRSRLQK